jgi:hypothetical protein
MNYIYDVVGFRHTAIVSVIVSVFVHVQNDLSHAQGIIVSAGKYTLVFNYRNDGKF